MTETKARRYRQWLIGTAGAMLALHGATGAVQAQTAQTQIAAAADLASMSLEDLSNLEVSSVSKRAEPLNQAAAAIYVVTADDIHRAGATSLPEMLRLAPNLQVAEQSARQFVVTARGFAVTNPNKLLVMIDGRSIYSPLESSVFWDQQEVMPEDIERIEVISGPGGTLWGANAVNGVINILTKSARDTQGLLASAAGGPDERSASARYGGTFGADGAYRFYVRGARRGHTRTAAGADVGDDYDILQGGGRLDLAAWGVPLTVQGDYYEGHLQAGRSTTAGRNVLARFGPVAGFEVQAYYDFNNRLVPGSIGDETETYDVDIKHAFSLGERHQFVWGGGYRVADGRFSNVPVLFVTPAEERLRFANMFVQDEIALFGPVKLALGIKGEHSTFSGWQALPSARLTWKVSEQLMVWSAVSRAVRSPSRVDRGLVAPPILVGNPTFDSEKLIAYEAGVRAQPTARLSLAVSGYYNDYDDLRTLELSPARALPTHPDNGRRGHTYGVEMWASYAATDWWRLRASATAMDKDLTLKPLYVDLQGVQALGNDPNYQAALQSSMNLTDKVTLDLALRAVGRLPNPRVPAYVELNGRLGWNVLDDVEVAISGFNLLHKRHVEFGALPGRSEISRTFLVSAQWRL